MSATITRTRLGALALTLAGADLGWSLQFIVVAALALIPVRLAVAYRRAWAHHIRTE